jgi:hypothetical protein
MSRVIIFLRELIAELKKSFPTIAACVGGNEDSIKHNFDLDYSLRPIKYFTDIAAAIDFMIYFVRPSRRVFMRA